MKTFIFSIFAFGLGFGGGYFTSYKLTKNKVLKQADKEIKSVKESLENYYNEKLEQLKTPKNDLTNVVEKVENPKKEKRLKPKDIPLVDEDSIDQDKLKANTKNEAEAYQKYTRKYKSKETVKEEKPEDIMKPYVISPEEFSESEYDVQTLNYYADGIVADDDYSVVTDIEGYLGPDALNSFGIYDLDVVYVRNEKYKIDYEILLDERRYYDIAPKGATTYSLGNED